MKIYCNNIFISTMDPAFLVFMRKQIQTNCDPSCLCQTHKTSALIFTNDHNNTYCNSKHEMLFFLEWTIFIIKTFFPFDGTTFTPDNAYVYCWYGFYVHNIYTVLQLSWGDTFSRQISWPKAWLLAFIREIGEKVEKSKFCIQAHILVQVIFFNMET